MPPPPDSSHALVSRFAFQYPSLLWGRVRLGPDGLSLTGWTWRGRYRRQIPFDRILHVDARADDELVLWLFNGEALRLRINRSAAWKAALNAAADAAGEQGGRAGRIQAVSEPGGYEPSSP